MDLAKRASSKTKFKNIPIPIQTKSQHVGQIKLPCSKIKVGLQSNAN
jgi:hypothetical protein